jgi:hypothetical protein
MRFFGPAAFAAPAPLIGVGWLIPALAWGFHICFDHAVERGLRTPEGFVDGKVPGVSGRPGLEEGR